MLAPGRVPAREQNDLGLAVVTDAERELPRTGDSPPSARAQRARQIVELQALKAQQKGSTLLAERNHQPVLRHLDRVLQLVRGIAGEHGARRRRRPRGSARRRPRESDRSRSARPAPPGRDQLGEALEQPLDRLGDTRIGRDAPVLAAPVEPSAGQPLDGLVELLVVGTRRRARAGSGSRRASDPARHGGRLVNGAVRHQTVPV